MPCLSHAKYREKSTKKPCRTENTLFLRLCIQTITTTTRITIYSNSCFLIGLDVISEHNTPFICLLWCSLYFEKGPVAQWIRHLTTNQGIPGSNPGGVAVILGKLTFYPLDFFYILITFHEVRKPDTTCGA